MVGFMTHISLWLGRQANATTRAHAGAHYGSRIHSPENVAASGLRQPTLERRQGFRVAFFSALPTYHPSSPRAPLSRTSTDPTSGEHTSPPHLLLKDHRHGDQPAIWLNMFFRPTARQAPHERDARFVGFQRAAVHRRAPSLAREDLESPRRG